MNGGEKRNAEGCKSDDAIFELYIEEFFLTDEKKKKN